VSLKLHGKDAVELSIKVAFQFFVLHNQTIKSVFEQLKLFLNYLEDKLSKEKLT